MEKYGIAVPADAFGEYTNYGRYVTLEEAEQAFEECPVAGKALVRYDQVGPFSWIGVTIKE